MQIELESLIRKILIHELELNDNQVWLYNDDFTLANKPDFYIAIEFLENNIIYNNVHYKYDSSGNMYQINSTGCKEQILLHIFSANKDARQRKVETVQAIESLYSLQQQELYQCRIFQIPNFLFSGKAARTREYSYTGNREGGRIIYYYNVILIANTWYEKERLIATNSSAGYDYLDGYDYFDTFGNEVYDDEQLLPIVEYNIPSS